MLQIIFRKITPSLRHKKIPKCIDYFIQKKCIMYTNQSFFKKKVYALSKIIKTKLKPHKNYTKLLLSDNTEVWTPTIANLPIGFILNINIMNIIRNNFLSYLGSVILLKLLPFGLNIIHITHKLQKKSIFAKSSGTFAIKVKGSKKLKLLAIILPSQKLKYLNINISGYIGQNFNFCTKQQIEGSWGYFFKKKKKTVRGVAMNPVDHPNGGRTKTNKPEKTPWGLIAKHNK